METTTTMQEPVTITDTLRRMEVGEKVEFPPSKTDYLRNIVSQRLIEERVAGMRWHVRLDMENAVTTVERTA